MKSFKKPNRWQGLCVEKPHWLIVNLIVYLQRSKEKEEEKNTT